MVKQKKGQGFATLLPPCVFCANFNRVSSGADGESDKWIQSAMVNPPGFNPLSLTAIQSNPIQLQPCENLSIEEIIQQGGEVMNLLRVPHSFTSQEDSVDGNTISEDEKTLTGPQPQSCKILVPVLFSAS